MKIFGGILLIIGIALLVVVIFSFFSQGDDNHSPIPENHGVKVIFVSPTP